MLPVLTPDEMAAADRACIAAGTPEPVLVERAGRAVARAARRRMGGTYGRHVVVVAGKGNNGADGVVAAGWLRSRGVRVTEMALSSGIDAAQLDRAFHTADLAIDAMFGTGFHGALEGDAVLVAGAFAAAGVDVLAVDIPSGVDGSTGAVRGTAVRAGATVCLAALKPGLVSDAGAPWAGDIDVVDIGVPLPEVALHVATAGDIAAWLPHRRFSTHKWDAGGVLVVGGSGGMTGAPMLASRAALRSGAGIVVCGLPGATAERAGGSEIITRAFPATDGGALTAVPLEGLGRFGAVVVGPGLGTATATAHAVREFLASAAAPVVIDADGINALAGEPELLRNRTAATVLTPHEGEFARLAGHAVGDDRVLAARALAAQSGATVVLKGPRTVIAAPDGEAVINTTGGPQLATAGTGDVLAGMIGGLIAQGLDGFHAAVAGVWLHGRAGVNVGSGLVAGDLVDALPRVFGMLDAHAAE